MKKILSEFLLIVIIISIMSLLYSAINYKVEAASQFDPNPYTAQIENDRTTNTSEISNMGKLIIGLIRGIGTAVSVIVLAVLGIKYMTGSVEERAEYKQTLLPYFIGAIMTFGISNLLPIIVNLAKSI